MRNPVVVFLVLLFGHAGFAQTRDNAIRLLAGVHLGMDRAKIVSPGAAPFRTGPWLAGSLELGTSLVHRNRWELALTGAFAMNGYNYTRDKNSYNVVHFTERAEAQFHWLLPMGASSRTYLGLGSGLGLSFQGNGSITSTESTFSATSAAQGRTALYLAPEATIYFGLGKHRLEAGLRYLRHLDRSPASYTTIQSGGATTVASTMNDHFGLVVRFHLGFMKRPPPPPEVPEVAYAERRTNMLASFTTTWDHITLELMDNAEYDGDSISIYMNDEPVLVGYELTKRKKRITVAVPYGANTLLVVAHNEGRVPPNTASCVLRRGKGREQLLIRTSKEVNTSVEIIRE